MKILLDECVTKHLKAYLSRYEVYTVREMNWGGIKNGNLMLLASNNGFDILLTIDKNLQFQQNLEKYKLTIVILNALSSTVEELLTFLPSFEKGIHDFLKSQAYLIKK